VALQEEIERSAKLRAKRAREAQNEFGVELSVKRTREAEDEFGTGTHEAEDASGTRMPQTLKCQTELT
jgi:hypothetical protein